MSELALQLIEEEKRRKTGYLDLGNCGLRSESTIVWDILSKMQYLEILILSNDWWDLEDKKYKYSQNESSNRRNRNFLYEIPKEIKYLLNLKKIVVAGSAEKHKWNIQEIENLPKNLLSLNISQNQIQNINNLPKNLHSLNIGGNNIEQIENLPQNLNSLDISNNHIHYIIRFWTISLTSQKL